MFEVGRVLPAWDNNRCAILAWLNIAQSDEFPAKVKTCRSKNELILSCRIVDCPVNVLIRFDESIGSEVVVETCLRHTHVLPCSQRLFSDADEKDQHDELDAKKADLVLDALRELSVLKNRGGKGVRYRFASDQDRAQAQAALKRDLLMVMKGEEVAQLWDRARLLGHLVGIEGARRLAATSNGSVLGRQSPSAASVPRRPPLAPAAAPGPRHLLAPSTTSYSTPLPSNRAFASLSSYANFITDWARSQDFSLQSAGGEGLQRVCSARKQLQCPFFITVKRGDGNSIYVVNSCISHSHRLKEKAALVARRSPASSDSGDQSDTEGEAGAVAGPSASRMQQVARRTESPKPANTRQLRSPSLTPKHSLKRERSRSPSISLTDKRQRRASTPLSDVSSRHNSGVEDETDGREQHAAPALGQVAQSQALVPAPQPVVAPRPVVKAAQPPPAPVIARAAAPSPARIKAPVPVAPPPPAPKHQAPPIAALRFVQPIVEAPVAQEDVAELIDFKTYLNALIPALPAFGDDHVELFQEIGIDDQNYLLDVVKRKPERLILLLSGGPRAIPVLPLEDLRDALLAKAAGGSYMSAD